MDRWSYVRAAAHREWLQCVASSSSDTWPAGSNAPEISAAPAGVQLVEALLARRGYDVARYPVAHPLLAGAWAALFPEMALAACDGTLSRQRQAFALAHELGHLVLHEAAHAHGSGDSAACGAQEIDAEADPQDALRGSLEVYNPRQQRELEANVFALNLLLPRPLIRRLFVDEALDARAIAERLEVSHTAALQALAGLLGAGPDAPDVITSGAGQERPLDLSQQAAATAMQGPVLVQAGPGTGKTGTLVGRVRYLLEERGLAADRLLLLTFSNRAVGELRGRLLGALGAGAQALTVSTFHSFAHELLRRYSAPAGLPADFRVLDRPALLIVLRAQLAEEAPAALVDWISLERPTAALSGLIEAVGRLKEELIDAASLQRHLDEPAPATEQPDEAAAAGRQWPNHPGGPPDEDRERSARLAAFYHWYERVLAAHGVLDYADLIMRVVRLLRQQPAIRDEIQARYPQLLVDEYQDINRASAALLLALSRQGSALPAAAAASLWAVGDPRQSIYRWRGAAPEVLRSLAPAGDAASGSVAYEAPAMPALRVNYRSLGPIVRLCGGVAAALDDLPVTEGRVQWQSARGEPDVPSSQARDTAPAILLATAADGASELAGIAREIQHSVAAGRTASDHAVLCATHAQADAVALLLRSAGLPVSRQAEPANDPAVRRALSLLALAAGDGEALLRLCVDAEESTQPLPALTTAGALQLLQEARARGERVLATLAHPPASLPADQQAAARAVAALVWSLPVMRAASEVQVAQRAAWTSLAYYLFDGPTLAARPVLAGDGDGAGGAPALAALL
ncbi:MAG TPA: UvrD-helicase domain-containing protein, partial [Chloroflexota bacterium]|nr:UvrD-helicase domain-containing protein [Chloroflexota bacterium]